MNLSSILLSMFYTWASTLSICAFPTDFMHMLKIDIDKMFKEMAKLHISDRKDVYASFIGLMYLMGNGNTLFIFRKVVM